MNNETKQTAVEWFMEQIGEKQPNGLYVIDTLEDVQNVFQQAKEMEKQQMIKAYASGYTDEDFFEDGKEWIYEAPQRYYNETYGGNK